jgi:hypothetical protein
MLLAFDLDKRQISRQLNAEYRVAKLTCHKELLQHRIHITGTAKIIQTNILSRLREATLLRINHFG